MTNTPTDPVASSAAAIGSRQDDQPVEPAVRRRQLLRGGALLAGAAGAAVAGSVVAAPTAHAADGDPLTLGQANEAESATELRVTGAVGADEATLGLVNADGPSLYLNPLAANWNGQLSPGQIANTVGGPLIGVVADGNQITTQLLTEQDVWLPVVLPEPLRLLDTRTQAGRDRIAQPSPVDANGRLPARTAMTIGIAPAGLGFGIPAVHLNLTVTNAVGSGWAVAYPGPDRPGTSTINFTAKQSIANGVFLGTSVGSYTLVIDPGQPPQQADVYVIFVYTTTAASIVLDATGFYATGFNPLEPPTTARAAQKSSPRTRALQKFGKLR